MTDQQSKGAAMALAAVNGMALSSAAAIAAMPYTPLVVDIALGFTAASLLATAAWTATINIIAAWKIRNENTPK